MSGTYPDFQSSYTHEEMVEHFLLTPADLSLVFACRGHVNRCGMALLLKTLPYLGYVPESLDRIPPEVHTFVAAQLGLLWDHSKHYVWNSRTRDQHLFLIRQHTGWRPPSAQDKEELEQWLRQHAAYEGQTTEYLFEAGCRHLRQLRVELPAEGELHRLANAALSAFFQDVHQRTAESVVASVRQRIDQLLIVPEAAPSSVFERLKSDPGKAGVDNFQAEIEKLKLIRSVDLAGEPFTKLPWNVLQVLKRRAMNETASEMRDHPEGIRYALMGCFLYVRAMEVTDDVTRMAIDLIHRLQKRSEKQIQREWLADLERVEGKMQILSRVAEAVVEKPDGIVREVIFPKVNEETFQNLLAEFRASSPQLRLLRQAVMHRKFASHYRRMLPALLENLQFRSDNRFQPLIEALAIIQKHLHTHYESFPGRCQLRESSLPSGTRKCSRRSKPKSRLIAATTNCACLKNWNGR